MIGLSSLINRFNLVKQIPIFAKLNWFDIQKIASKSGVSEHKKGELVCSENAPPDFFYCLVSGRLQAYSLNEDGVKENVEFIHRGMYFGIISVFTGEDHSLTFEAINDSIVLKIAKDDFHNILMGLPQLGVTFSHSLSKRIRRKVKGGGAIFESKIVSVYSPVNGTGSSMYALNLALNLEKETKKKVILVHIHLLQDEDSLVSTEKLQLAWRVKSIQLDEIADDYDKIVGSVIKDDLKIDLLNVVFDVTDTSVAKQMGSLVSALVGDYHYVVVDLPNETDEVVTGVLTQSDLVHLLAYDRREDLSFIRNVIDRLEVTLQEKFQEERICVIIRAIHDKIYLSFEEINKCIDYHVYTMLPLIHDVEKNKVDMDSLSFYCCDEKSEYAKIVLRIARQIGDVLVGIVLGGGAALGLAHIGVIRVLEEENIPVDVVVGSSMGALIGSFWTTGKKADELEAIACEFEKKKNLIKLFDPVIPLSGLIGGRGIARWLKKHLGNQTFYSTKIPFKIVAYDLIRREEIVINGGSLVDAVRKSIAIPGVVEPIMEKGKLIIDGGVLNPLPTNVLAGLGVKKIIAVNVLQSPEDVAKGVDVLEAVKDDQAKVLFLKSPLQFISIRIGNFFSKLFAPNISDIIVRTLQATEYVIADQSAQQADITIHPDLVGINWFELYRAKDLIKRGEDATRKLLPEIKKLVEEG